jgi:hypothetical protein
MKKEKLKLIKIAFFLLITLAFLQQASAEKQIELQESSQCGNIVCEAGENRTECAIDCGSALSHIDFSDMMKLFDIAYYEGRAQGIAGIEFFLGAGVGYEQGSGSDKYCYLSATNNHNDEKESKSYWLERMTFVSLTKADIDGIYTQYQDSEGKVRRGILERKDIEQFCTENYSIETCNEIKFGVQTDDKLNLALDSDNNPIADSPIEDYQNGKTIVYPTYYHRGDGLESRPYYNFNNPVVSAYAIELVLKTQEKCGTNLIFMDNFLPSDNFYDKSYVSSETKEKQMETHALNLLEILKKVKERNPQTKFILNGYASPDIANRNKFLDIATSPGQKDNFEMIMFENRFHEDLYGLCTILNDHDGYYFQVKKLYDTGKNVLFTASEESYLTYPNNQSDNYKAYKIWLWTHLVGNELSYLYINDYYTKPMIDYNTYSYKLGQPLEEPHKEDPSCHVNCTWLRKFKRGTIVFDTTSKKLDAIKFIEDTSQACGNNICDTDIGETFATCAADCAQVCIDKPMLLGFIGQWKRGEITMLALMQKMRQWNRIGCPPK